MRLEHHRIKLTNSRVCEQFLFSHCLQCFSYYAQRQVHTIAMNMHPTIWKQKENIVTLIAHSMRLLRLHNPRTLGARIHKRQARAPTLTHTRMLVKSISVMEKRKNITRI